MHDMFHVHADNISYIILYIYRQNNYSLDIVNVGLAQAYPNN